MEKKPKRTKTQNRLAAWKFLDDFMEVSKYVVAELPALIMVLVKHQDWFPTKTQTVSVSMGLSMFCLTIFISVIAIAKKEEILKKVNLFIVAAFYLIMIGITCLFLANILTDFGWLCVYTGAGMCIAVVEDVVDKVKVKERVNYWNGILSAAGLNIKENKQNAKKEADIRKAKEEARDLL